MKKIFLFILALFMSAETVLPQEKTAQDRTADRAELQKLLEERQKKFNTYSESLKKRSGFFGGKSKGDIQHSNEVLRDIIETDNRMISVLNRVVDFKTYEKVNMNYDLLSCNERVENLQRAVDVLNNRVTTFASSNDDLKKKAGTLKTLSTILGILVLVMLVFMARRNFQK
jgi:cell division protein FtsB